MQATPLPPSEVGSRDSDGNLVVVASEVIATFKAFTLHGYLSHAASRNREVAKRPLARARGSHRRPRSAQQRSSARSGDSGDGDPDPPGEPGQRCCQNPACGALLPPSSRSDKKYCDAACRQELHRHPDDPKKPKQADKYLRSTSAVSWAWELEALKVRAAEGCRCNGSHVLDPADGGCVKCGRVRDTLLWEQEASEPSYVRALSAERDHEREFQAVAS